MRILKQKSSAPSERHVWIVVVSLVALMMISAVVVLLVRQSGRSNVDVAATPTPQTEVSPSPAEASQLPDDSAFPSPSSLPSPTTSVSDRYVKTAIVVDGERVLVLSSYQAAEELMLNVQLYFAGLDAIPTNAVTILKNNVSLVTAQGNSVVTDYDTGYALLTGAETPLVYESIASFTEDEIVPHEVGEVTDSSLPLGARIVTVYGRDGINRNSYTARYLNGTRIELVLNDTSVIREVLTGEIRVGSARYSDSYAPDADFGDSVSMGDMSFIMPVSGEIIRYYGPYGGCFHHGVDIAAELDADVVSVYGGTVVSVMVRGDYGLMVEIDHGNGFTTRYAQLSSASVSVGDLVLQGQTIGKVGTGGSSDVPHLHFEVRVDGFAVNPLFCIPFED